MSMKILFSLKPTNVPAYGALAAACHLGKVADIKFEFNLQEVDVVLHTQSGPISGNKYVLRALSSMYPEQFCTNNAISSSQVDYWMDFSQIEMLSSDFKKISQCFGVLDNHLTLRSFFVDYHLTAADFAIWGALKANAIFNKQIKSGKMPTINLLRWYAHMNSLDSVVESIALFNKAKEDAKDRSDQGSMDIPLPEAIVGQVVTRFPPEPSGYLHIGHAKAALLNDYFAKMYKGKMLLRFDDTNPSKEKVEFEESIKEDLKMLEITPDSVSHTSEHFPLLYEYALKLIKLGKAYVDDTDVDTMREMRGNGTESKNRSLSIDENLKLFEEMKNGTEKGLNCCLRAKIDMKDKNKCMRDPVIYRCNLTPHHITGDKWKLYPTYDFCCPIVDSIEGVTHALRTIEYRDRNPQYLWFLKALSLRHVHVWDFSRLNFIYTLLSKRKLTWFVEQKVVSGWDDPRFATVRGILRRGMTVEALRNYIISQGASQREILLEWDKIWSGNKKVIDPVSPRHTALEKKDLYFLFKDRVTVEIVGDSAPKFEVKSLAKHKKNPVLGNKNTTYGPVIFLEQVDAAALDVGEEVTLMDWGNAFVKTVEKSGQTVSKVTMSLNLNGDFKKTKKKLTWLCENPNDSSTKLSTLSLLDYDYLITKKKLEEDDSFEDCLNSKTVFQEDAVGDANLKSLKKSDIIQLERKGFYICDKPWSSEDPCINLIFVPDGKAESVALKADLKKSLDGSIVQEGKPKGASKSTVPNMYSMDAIYKISDSTSTVGNMYAIESIYPKVARAAAQEEVIQDRPKEKKQKKPKGSQPVSVPAETSIISKLDLVVGKVLDVKKHPDADSLFIETVDVGEAEPRQVVSGLVKFLKPEEIEGKLIVVLKNLKPVAMRGVKSYAMVMCASNVEHTKVELLIPPAESIPGDKVFFEGHEGEPELQLNPKKKVFETIQPDLATRDDLVAVWKGIPFKTSKGLIKSATLAKASIK